MKVLILSAKDTDGGASKAAYRLHRGLRELGHESIMFVAKRSGDDPAVRTFGSKFRKFWAQFVPKVDAVFLRRYRARRSLFSVNNLPDGLLPEIRKIDPDLVHIHWVGQGFMNISTLKKIPYPTVWTFHDMWAFTGGCHYAGSCERFMDTCGACPQLGSAKKNDITYRELRRKKRNWDPEMFTVIAPSRWMGACARNSALLRSAEISTIPYNIDTDVFKPMEKEVARKILNLSPGKKIVLFGAMSATSDPRKGFKFLKEAIDRLTDDEARDIELLIYGSSRPLVPIESKCRVVYAGVLKDDVTLALCYAAADVFIAPSTEDNLPLTVMESLSCGTPAVAFDIGGMSDMIEHRANGYLARPFSVDDLREGILWTLSKADDLGRTARETVLSRFTTELVVSQHISLYQSRIEKHSKNGGK